MSTPIRILRPFLAACLFLAALLPLRAQNWQTFDIRLAAGRVGHDFQLEAYYPNPAMEDPSSASLIYLDPSYMQTQLSAYLDAESYYSLFDGTTGERFWLDTSSSTIDLTGPFLGGYSSIQRLSFLVESSRAGHAFAVYQWDTYNWSGFWNDAAFAGWVSTPGGPEAAAPEFFTPSYVP